MGSVQLGAFAFLRIKSSLAHLLPRPLQLSSSMQLSLLLPSTAHAAGEVYTMRIPLCYTYSVLDDLEKGKNVSTQWLAPLLPLRAAVM